MLFWGGTHLGEKASLPFLPAIPYEEVPVNCIAHSRPGLRAARLGVATVRGHISPAATQAFGCGRWDRTTNLLIMSQALYRLRYPANACALYASETLSIHLCVNLSKAAPDPDAPRPRPPNGEDDRAPLTRDQRAVDPSWFGYEAEDVTPSMPLVRARYAVHGEARCHEHPRLG